MEHHPVIRFARAVAHVSDTVCIGVYSFVKLVIAIPVVLFILLWAWTLPEKMFEPNYD